MTEQMTAQKVTEQDWRDRVQWYTHQTVTARLIKGIAAPFFQIIARSEHHGVENIPKNGGLVLVCNHISLFDVPYIVIQLPRHPHFMAKKELFKGAFAWVVRMFGGFPINRGERDTWAMEQSGRVLGAEQVLFMFPEGTRSGQEAQLKRGKIGAVRLALEHQVPVLPMSVLGTQHIEWGWRKNHITLHFGEPMDVVAMAGEPPYSNETLQDITDQMMQRIAAMLPPAHRGYYGED